MPYTQFNGATFPAVDPGLLSRAPSVTDQSAVIAFIKEYVPDSWQGLSVHFYSTYMSTVNAQIAFPSGGDLGLLPGFNLEMWGLPTSLPATDPNNHNFVYQRFQRGILMYDASTGLTQGVLLADYLKGMLTLHGIPDDLWTVACDGPTNAYGQNPSPFCGQYSPGGGTYLARPDALPETNLSRAFVQDDPMAQAALLHDLDVIGPCGRGYLIVLYPQGEPELSQWIATSNYQPAFAQLCQSNPVPDWTLMNQLTWQVAVHPFVFLAPGVADALARWQELNGDIPNPLVGQRVPIASFLGNWTNQVPNTRSITHASIGANATTIYVHMWGKCTPTDCDWGQTTTPAANAANGVLYLAWAFSFAVDTQQVTILPDGRLAVNGHTHFTDNSGRADYSYTDYFLRQ